MCVQRTRKSTGTEFLGRFVVLLVPDPYTADVVIERLMLRKRTYRVMLGCESGPVTSASALSPYVAM